MLLLSHIHQWTRELERVVDAYEAAVDDVEALLDQLERDTGFEEDWLTRIQQDRQTGHQLAQALETAEHLAQLVQAANAILDDALATTTIGLELLTSTGDALLEQRSTSTLTNAEANADDTPFAITPLPDGAIILQGKYRIVQLLHARPRLHLYLAQRLPAVGPQFIASDDACKEKYSETPQQQQHLVAIRELVLTGLSPRVRKQIEHAAFEEFVSPMLLGSPRLPGTGDRIRIENDRHYLVMQLRPARGQRQATAITLAELLMRQQWPVWLDMETALEWGVQLCRIVARLHHLGAVLGDLNPTMVLVDAERASEWAPVLLVSWPPAPQFWESRDGVSAQELCARIFPLAIPVQRDKADFDNAFAAPETLVGTCDQRSDVYSLGAILYLLLTRYAPAAAVLREQAKQTEQADSMANGKAKAAYLHNGSAPLYHSSAEGMALIPPRLFNYHIPPVLEHILFRSLALNPAERYASAFDLVEALEAVEPQDVLITAAVERKAPRVAKVKGASHGDF